MRFESPINWMTFCSFVLYARRFTFTVLDGTAYHHLRIINQQQKKLMSSFINAVYVYVSTVCGGSYSAMKIYYPLNHLPMLRIRGVLFFSWILFFFLLISLLIYLLISLLHLFCHPYVQWKFHICVQFALRTKKNEEIWSHLHFWID